MDNALDVVDLRKYIDTQFYGERPHIRGHKLLVTFIVAASQSQGWSVDELAEQFSISAEQAAAALLYYFEHKDQIDAQDVQAEAQWEEAYAQQDPQWLRRWEGRNLQEKLST
jgi:uncharacterized protein (DUF433 family)